jgi:hypothetical protein
MITVENVKMAIKDLEKRREMAEDYLVINADALDVDTRSAILSDIDLFKRFSEMLSDLDEEDIKHQDRMKEFFQVKDRAVSEALPLWNSIEKKIMKEYCNELD